MGPLKHLIHNKKPNKNKQKKNRKKKKEISNRKTEIYFNRIEIELKGRSTKLPVNIWNYNCMYLLT